MAQQIKYHLDPATLKKVGRGALIAGAGAAGLYILNFLGSIELGNPVLTSFLAWFIPFAVNFIKEWMKGKKVPVETNQ